MSRGRRDPAGFRHTLARVPGLARALGACLLLGVLLLPAFAHAQERILRYDSEVEILDDGSLEVAEHITVRAEGREIRRGIYRDFPTRYRDRYGNRVRVDLEVLGVERDGRPEEWFTERRSNGIRINTGGDDLLPVPAEYTFTLRYRTTRQLGFFEEHDELYWNAIGTGWAFPIEEASVEVRLPEPVPMAELHAEGYTGPQGAQGEAYEAVLPEPGTARYRLTEPLQPREGLTIVLTFPKGVVAEPTTGERIRWFLGDNRGVLVALIGLIGLLVFCLRRWRAVGRDPRPGVIIPRYRPPEGHGPAGLRYLARMGYDARCFSSDLLALAVAGRVRIGSRKKLLGEEWWLERVASNAASPRGGAGKAPSAAPPAAADAPDRMVDADRTVGAPDRTADDAGRTAHAPGLAADTAHRSADSGSSASGAPRPAPGAAASLLLDKLLPPGTSRLDLEKSNAETVSGAQTAHRKSLHATFHPRFFRRNSESAWLAGGIAAVTILLAFAVSGGNGIPAIIVLGILMGLATIAFAAAVRARTPEGRRLLDEIEGFKLYLGVAEGDELARLPGPDEAPLLDAERYEALLPYAVALEVEDAWTRKFTAAVGAAAAAEAASRMTWYSGHLPVTNLGNFSKAMGSNLTSQISSASTPPGSSSGAGGGGFSGGGGGGGGGGGR